MSDARTLFLYKLGANKKQIPLLQSSLAILLIYIDTLKKVVFDINCSGLVL